MQFQLFNTHFLLFSFSKNMLKKTSLLFFIFISLQLFAQEKDEPLAAQYFSNKEFDKAADVYEKLVSRNSQSVYFYDNLLQCYFNLNKFEDAEKLAKKQARKNNNSPYYTVDLGYIYKKWNKPEKAKKQFENVLSLLVPNEEIINETSGAFKKRNEKEFAIYVYLKGRKLLQSNLFFCIELGGLYMETGKTKEMIEEYLNLVSNNPMAEEEVQGLFQNYLNSDAEYELLKNALLKQLKIQGQNDVFYEMLLWFYVQRKDYGNALIQAKSIDKRCRALGKRILDLGYLAVANEQYDAAIKIFNEVVLIGDDKPYYRMSKLGILNARNKKLLTSASPMIQDLKLLEKDYQDFLIENGKSNYTASSQKELANLQAQYLFDYSSAIANYNELINMQDAEKHFRAECKLELADVYVLKGEVWEAMLLYGQVDKDFLEDPLGQEAKFRQSKLSYYLGEFEWARAQLDVLKTATTQLIANNALELSLMIQDNTVDSIEDALKLFSKADLFYFQNNTDSAFIFLDSINKTFPKHALSDDIAFKKAQIYTKQNKFIEAAIWLNIVVNEHGTDILGDNALYALARLYDKNMGDKETAKKLYEKFIETYPGSLFIIDSRKRFRILRGDLL